MKDDSDARSPVTGGPSVPDEELRDGNTSLDQKFYKNVAKGAAIVGGLLGGGYAIGTASESFDIDDYLKLMDYTAPGYADAVDAAAEASTHAPEAASYTADILNSL